MMMMFNIDINLIKLVMITHIAKAIRLNTLVAFTITRPRRHPSIPTQGPVMSPFSIQNLHDNPGASRKPKELGRGPGSGKGKFAARGMKGDKARSGGGVPVRFEGGQNPLTRRLRKYGRTKRKYARRILNEVNLKHIVYFIKRGIIDPKQVITEKKLQDVGLAKKVKYGIKILGKGIEDLEVPLNIQASDASANVIEKIKSLGGSVRLIYRTPLKLREHLHPQKFPLPLKTPLPPAYQVKKLDKISKNRGVEVEYRKPQWKIEAEALQKQKGEQIENFIYPVPRDPNPNKIRSRKPKIYKRISYKL